MQIKQRYQRFAPMFLGTREGLFPTIFAKKEKKKKKEKVSGYILVEEKKKGMEGGGNNKKFSRLF